MDVSRRKFLAGLAAASAIGVLGPAEVALAQRERKIVLRDTITPADIGRYKYLPFEVPRRTKRLDVKLTVNGEDSVGVGLFDWRGTEYQSPGFRGVYGEEDHEFFLAPQRASVAFIPGDVRSGKWTVIVPVFRAESPSEIKVTITFSLQPEGDELSLGREVGVVKSNPGWYKGDLHCHTVHSSDARASGTALTPAGWARTAKEIGLDWVSLTDHNVTTQNRNLREAAGETGVLLLGGEEMTNWFHGHATVPGLPLGAWLDWRQRPEGVPLDEPEEARIERFVVEVERLGAYSAAAHPSGANLSWQFFADAGENPKALPDGLEVWTGPFQPDDEATLEQWDRLLKEGRRIFANGGSDTHGTENSGGFVPGSPTTIVYADALSKKGVVAALKAGRGFVTSSPKGAGLYLSATGPAGQRQIVGGTIYGEATDTARFSVLVRKGADKILILLRDGQQEKATPITSGEQTVTLDQSIGSGGYVRAELRGESSVDPTNPVAGKGPMEALTNPIFLVQGPQPEGNEPQTAPPPPTGNQKGPAR
jgi:hypothetical protein